MKNLICQNNVFEIKPNSFHNMKYLCIKTFVLSNIYSVMNGMWSGSYYRAEHTSGIVETVKR